MDDSQKLRFTKDYSKKQITVIRKYSAPIGKVWRAWTERNLIDEWWAPKPWKAESEELNFENGGNWFYAMVGPSGEKQFCLATFRDIAGQDHFGYDVSFSDVNRTALPGMPLMHWDINFMLNDQDLQVTIYVQYETEEEMKTVIDMGFEEGFTAGLNNLETILTEDY